MTSIKRKAVMAWKCIEKDKVKLDVSIFTQPRLRTTNKLLVTKLNSVWHKAIVVSISNEE